MYICKNFAILLGISCKISLEISFCDFFSIVVWAKKLLTLHLKKYVYIVVDSNAAVH